MCRTAYFQGISALFVGWQALSRYLSVRFGNRSEGILAAARNRADVSLARASRYLRRKGVNNVHRFLRPVRMNDQIGKALSKWVIDFEEGLNV
jgi:hypothetical protein